MFSTIDAAIKDLQQGKVIIVCDDEDRENEGDFVALAQYMTLDTVNFMITYGKGLLCAPISPEYANRLGLSPMVTSNQDTHQTAFSYSIDYAGCKTGISAYERCYTLKELARIDTTSKDFQSPGHVFPLIAKTGGVLERAGHTEAAVDLAYIAKSNPVAAICEIINQDGSMARLPDLIELSHKFKLKIIHIKDLILYRKRNESLVHREVETKLPSKFGDFKMLGYRCLIDNQEALALVKGDLAPSDIPLVRIHSECLTGDSLGSLRCDCGEQLSIGLNRIEQYGGILIYLRQEGRGIGLLNKFKAYALQDQGIDTVDANLQLGFANDLRDYYIAAQILRDLGITKIKLMTNNPDKLNGLKQYGITVTERVALLVTPNTANLDYLTTKSAKLGHLFFNEFNKE